MEFPQSTIDEIIESEQQMVVSARERYGQHYTHALECSIFLSRCITSLNHDRMMFGRFFALMKKHHTLALFSALRLHKVQAMMNLRQVLEAGASAAFAIANPELMHFADADEHGILDPSPELTKKRYRWLHKHHLAASDWIKETKELINSSTAHANIITADSVFRITETGDQMNTPFFDIEDDYFVKADLWLIASVAITLMNLFYGVNQSRNVIEFRHGFAGTIDRLAKDSNAILDATKATERYKRTAQKMTTRAESKALFPRAEGRTQRAPNVEFD